MERSKMDALPLQVTPAESLQLNCTFWGHPEIADQPKAPALETKLSTSSPVDLFPEKISLRELAGPSR